MLQVIVRQNYYKKLGKLTHKAPGEITGGGIGSTTRLPEEVHEAGIVGEGSQTEGGPATSHQGRTQTVTETHAVQGRPQQEGIEMHDLSRHNIPGSWPVPPPSNDGR